MLHGHTVSAVIVAAGASTRMGFDKLAYEYEGASVLAHSVAAFDHHPAVDEIIVVASGNSSLAQQVVKQTAKHARIVIGGAQRLDSVRAGVQAASGEYVAIHDAARPFVSADVIGGALEKALEMGAAAPAVPVKDTVKQARDGWVQATPPRRMLFAVQTPQCFARALYVQALEKLRRQDAPDVTDDCSVMELAGFPVALTVGEYANLKITTLEDLPAAQPARGESTQAPRRCAAKKGEDVMRIGHGYDVHKLVEGRPLILGGVAVPFEKGLLGHSDADVLAHAVMDALLGAAALGDIGQLFPDTSPAFAGADSLQLAREVARRLKQAGWQAVNVDATILCQKPKLAPHIPAMRRNLANAFEMSVSCVSVKATTEEGLGFTGCGQGIAAHSVCLIRPVGTDLSK